MDVSYMVIGGYMVGRVLEKEREIWVLGRI